MEKIFVLGAGTMGAGIVQAFAQKGYEVIVRDIKDFFKKQEIYVKINDKNCRVLGRIGTYHITCDITNKDDIKIGDKVILNINPKFVDSGLRREYR